jgi:GNAT superfamily N-acetyltransferase
MSVQIQKANPQDFEQIWPTFQAVVQGGDTYTYPLDITKEEAKSLWFAPDKTIHIATVNGEFAGTYYLRPNQPGLGSHVSNAGFMVNPIIRGKGVGKQMGLHALALAREQGYYAMQFNSVVSTNTYAVHLWKSLGFEIIATVPKAFQHKMLGLVDIFIMHRFL